MGAPEFTIKRVSFSRLMEFENCAYATKLKVIDKRGDWLKVVASPSKQEGWLIKSATEK